MFERKLRDMEWTLPSPKWIFVFNILLFLLRVSLGKTLATVRWDKNSNFGTGLIVEADINDQMRVECAKTPNTTTGRQYAQYLTFVQVSREGYESCDTGASGARLLLVCNRPFEDNSLIMVFWKNPPRPGALTFRHGQNYYFITTSDGTLGGLSETQNGLCVSHNMKLMVRINPRPTEPPPTGMTTPRMRPSSRPSIRTTRPTTVPTTHPRTTPSPKPSTQKPVVSTDKSVGDKPKKTNPNPRAGDSGSMTLRQSPLLLCLGCCVALLRWLKMT